MPTHDLGALLASDVAALDLERVMVVIPVSPVEEHGPHLPLATDILESDGMARKLCERLEGEPSLRGWTFLLHPPLPIGADVWEYPGSIDVPAATVERVVSDIGVALGRQGFRRILLANNHGGPRHNLALERAARRIERKTPARALSIAGRLMVSFFFEDGLEAFLEARGVPVAERPSWKVDFHAGAFETSEMLALHPGHVRDGWQKLLPFTLPFGKMRRDSALAAGPGKGYFGAPARASRELGEAYVAFILDRIAGDVTRFLLGERVTGMSFKWRVAIAAMAGWADARETAVRFSRALRGPRRRAPRPSRSATPS